MWGTLSVERMGLQFTHTSASGPFQSSHSSVQVPQNSQPYFTVSFETPPTWKARSPYLYPWALGSLFVTSYDSQGYSGGILTHLHTGHSLSSGQSKKKIKLYYDQQSVGQGVLVSGTPSGTHHKFFLLLSFVDVGRPL
jgi:hypothetical protein